MKRKLSIIALVWLLASCDKIDNIKAPVIYVANIPNNTLLTLAAEYPQGKNFVVKELNEKKFWEIKMEADGQNIQLIADADGDLLENWSIYGSNEEPPSKIIESIKRDLPKASINNIAKVNDKTKQVGYEVNLANANQSIVLLFDNDQNPAARLLPTKKHSLNQIVESNSLQYNTETLLPDALKNTIKPLLFANTTIKFLKYDSGYWGVQLTQNDSPTKANKKIDYLFDQNLQLASYKEYLAPTSFLQKEITASNIGSYTLSELQKKSEFSFNSGYETGYFGITNKVNLVFKNALGDKLLAQFDAKNDNPKYTMYRQLNTNQLPAAIQDYLGKSTAKYLNAKLIYKPSLLLDDPNLTPNKYIVEVKLENGQVKLLLFDENLITKQKL
jgi:hypothetical protein